MAARTTEFSKIQIVQTVIAVIAIVVLLAVVGLLMTRINIIGPQIASLAGMFQDQNGMVTLAVAPGWLVGFENATPTLAVVTWIAMGLLVLFLVFGPARFRVQLVESWRPLDVALGLIAGGVLSGLTGYLWAVWNPVPVLPPFIHLRIFSFLIGVWGILLGRGTGFLTGYFGGVVWGFFSGYFLLPHTPISDGFWVGTMTGFWVSVMVRQGKSREELLQAIDANRWKYYLRCAWVGLVGGLVMAFFVALSMKVTSPLSWWASFWAIGVLSDTLPMVIWIGPVSEAALRLTRRLTWLPNF